MKKKKHCYWRRETILRRIKEYRQTPEGANDRDAEALAAAIKKRLEEKAEKAKKRPATRATEACTDAAEMSAGKHCK